MFSKLFSRSLSILNVGTNKPIINNPSIVRPMTQPITNYKDIKVALLPYQTQLMSHPLYSNIQNIEQVKFFMQSHVFAVWDFMSLLKALQLRLTCVSLPWLPPANPELAYFINSIVIGEETDDLGTHDCKKAISHYQLYLNSMNELGSNTEAVTHFVGKLQNGEPWRQALDQTKRKFSHLPVNTFEFVEFTMNIVENGSVPEIAASFLFGREDPIPHMFQKFLTHFEDKKNIHCPNFKLYLQRHIDVDGDHHGPMADLALGKICTDLENCEKAFTVARDSIKMRMHLWDGIYSKMN